MSLTVVKYPVRPREIYTFVPNLIGFARVILLVLSFFSMKGYPTLTMGLFYSTSCLLDAFDGYYARKFGQSTKFGAVLDMVTDRCSTCSLIVYLSILYPNFYIGFQILVSLDLASHYVHMYAQINSGSNSHKNLNKDANWLLKFYYESRTFLFWVCAFNEIFYVALYLYHFDYFYIPGTDIDVSLFLVFTSAPIWAFKQFCNVIQLVNASDLLAELDAKLMNAEHVNRTTSLKASPTTTTTTITAN